MPKDRRMRIGVDLHGWTRIFQGTRSHLFGLYAEAVKLAPDLDFVILAEAPEKLRSEWVACRSPNVTVVDMKPAHGLVRLAWQLPTAVVRYRLDLLHVQYRVPVLFSGRSVVTIHDVLFERYPEYFGKGFVAQSKILFRAAARSARRVLTVSEYSRNELATLYGADPRNVVITPNGVDRARFHPLRSAEDEGLLSAAGVRADQYVLSVGRLEPRKNQVSVIRAFCALGRRDLALVLVGQRDFQYSDVLGEIEAARSAGFNVVLLENVGDQELPILMRNALAFVFLAFAEGFGMPPLEAMASGTPVIVSNTTAMPEVVGDAGLLVDPGSTKDAAAALQMVVDSGELRRELVQRGLARAETYTWAAAAEQLVSALRGSLA